MKVVLGWLHIRRPWLEQQGELSGKGKVSPEPTQTSASGPGLFHISLNDPKKQKSNVEVCERGRAEGVSTALEVLGVKKEKWVT